MKIAICNPYGSSVPEAAALAAFTRILPDYGHELVSLGCDGCVAACDKFISPETGLRRRLHECFSCMQDQKRLNDALGIRSVPLSSFITTEIVQRTFSTVMTCKSDSLSDLTWRGEAVLWLARSSLKVRFGSVESALKIPNITSELRGLMSSAMRAMEGAIGFLNEESPDLVIIIGRDVLAESFAVAARELGISAARLIHEKRDGSLQILHPTRNEILSHHVLGLADFRVADSPEDWSQELTDSVREMMLFLDIPASQLALFAANQA